MVTTAVSEQERVRSIVEDVLQGGELVSVEMPQALITPDQVTITVASSEAFTEGLTKDAARLAVSTVLEGLVSANLDSAVTRFRAIVTYDLVNQFGEVSNSTVVDVVYDRAVAERIQFDNFLDKTVLTLPSINLYIHPAFAKEDGS